MMVVCPICLDYTVSAGAKDAQSMRLHVIRQHPTGRLRG